MGELYDREQMALEELETDILNGDIDSSNESDRIWEIADGCVPIYNGDILQCAMDNLWLATCNPESGLEYESPIQGIQINIMEHIMEKMWEYWNDEGENLCKMVFTIQDDYEDIIDDLKDQEIGGEDETDITIALHNNWDIDTDNKKLMEIWWERFDPNDLED